MAPAVEKSATLLEQATPSSERFLDRDLGFQFATGSYQLKVIGRVVRQSGFRSYDLPSQGNQVRKGRTLNFRIEQCNVPVPYQVYWKVRNTGREASDRGELRGEITQGTASKSETTRYRGSHWVDCYIVKDGKCVARSRQQVLVK